VVVNLTNSFDGFAFPAQDVSPFENTFYDPNKSESQKYLDQTLRERGPESAT